MYKYIVVVCTPQYILWKTKSVLVCVYRMSARNGGHFYYKN